MLNRFQLRCCLLLVALLTSCYTSHAGEGMWMLQSLQSTIGSKLKSAGLQLPLDSLYHPQASSLKDAVVQFGGGCTGEVVSSQGLVLTNHHCGFSQIQALSSLEKNYLDSGFWAKSFEEELPCPGLTVTFIREIRDVSETILSLLSDTLTEETREQRIRELSDSLSSRVAEATGRSATVRSFYHGNAFFLFVTEVFRDIRLVGTPPAAIGNFGGETDNWMWPRQTGDFAVFRIYANRENRPAAYSIGNVPYRPLRWFPIQTSGVNEGDFTMVFGFPGKTNQYLPSAAIRTLLDQTNPNKVAIRQARLSAWDQAMDANDTVRLQYAAKYRSLANYYKKWKGELAGMKKHETLLRMQREERTFRQWVATEKALPADYRKCLDELNLAYGELRPLSLASDYFGEAIFGVELISTGQNFRPLLQALDADSSLEVQQRLAARLAKGLESFYRNYDARLDRIVAGRLIPLAMQALPARLQPPDFLQHERFTPAGLDSIFRYSLLTRPDTLLALLKNWNSETGVRLREDPAISLADRILTFQKEQIDHPTTEVQRRINRWQRIYMAARIRQAGEGRLAPDANGTLRITYGKVEGMEPRDGVRYEWQSTLRGILEKAATGEDDYRIPDRLRATSVGEEELPVAFLASNHTTNGNSGSPVLNSKGELIGINFDRIWEGVMSDYDYDATLSRNISVDIRYVLFVITRYGEAQRLVGEMELRKAKEPSGKR
jgi:uncharacterized protein YeaO (DUF488 family)